MSSLYVLTDLARDHYWTGEGFLPVEEGPYPPDDLACFASRAEARRQVREHRRSGGYLRAVPLDQERELKMLKKRWRRRFPYADVEELVLHIIEQMKAD